LIGFFLSFLSATTKKIKVTEEHDHLGLNNGWIMVLFVVLVHEGVSI